MSGEVRPRVSVVMSTYNDAQYVGDAIRSVLSQSYSNLELIVVDAGSSDSTPEVVSGFVDPRLRYIRKGYQGLARSLNDGIASARGEWIARQDADDVSEPERLRAQFEELEKNEEISLLGSGVTLIGSDGTLLRRVWYPKEHERLVSLLRCGFSPLVHSSVVFRREAALQVGCYDSRFERTEDLDFFLRFSKRFRVGTVQAPLLRLRYRTDSMTFNRGNLDCLVFAVMAVYRSRLQERGIAWLEDNGVFEAAIGELRAHLAEREGRQETRVLASQERRTALGQFGKGKYVKGCLSVCRAVARDPRWIWARFKRDDISQVLDRVQGVLDSTCFAAYRSRGGERRGVLKT